MTKPHKYEYNIKRNSSPDRVTCMIGSNKKVLELGSGPGVITEKLTANNCVVTALEIDESAIEIVRHHCENVYQCDFNNPDWPLTLKDIGDFEILVAADVFEHLIDPLCFAKNLHQYFAPGGSLIVSIPHVGHAAIMACLLNSDFDYKSWGLLDKTHIRFFGLTNVQKLFEVAGYKIIEAEFVVVEPSDTELAKHWARLPSSTQKELLLGKFSRIYQVVLRVVPTGSTGNAINLVSMTVPKPNFAIFGPVTGSKFGTLLSNNLSPNFRNRMKGLLKHF